MLLSIVAFSAVTFSISAHGADIPRPYKAPAYIAPVFSWTGFYIGINGGYVKGSSKWSGGAGDFEVSPQGWMLGGTLGYNYQAGNWVFGLEGDINYLDLNGTSSACATCTFKDTWLSTVRGRAGLSFDRWLPYLTGGLAYGNAYVETGGGSENDTKAGWTVGGGVEYAFLGGWSAKLEYLYVDLGTTTCQAANCGLASDANVAITQNIIRAGLNYRF